MRTADSVPGAVPSHRLARGLTWCGLLAILGGTADPIEGAPVILLGAILAAAGAVIAGGRERILLIWAAALVAAGTGVMAGLSAIGGIGGSTGRSNWWGLLLLPYAVGWVCALVGTLRMLRGNQHDGSRTGEPAR